MIPSFREATTISVVLTFPDEVHEANDIESFTIQFYYDGYYSRLKLTQYGDMQGTEFAARYAIEIAYTKYGSLQYQYDKNRIVSLLEISSWDC